MNLLRYRSLVGLFGLVVAGWAAALPAPAQTFLRPEIFRKLGQGSLGCPFCSDLGGTTLTGDVNQASMVLFGTLGNARLDPNGDFGAGQTDLSIAHVIWKNDKDGNKSAKEFLGDKKVITLPRYIPGEKDNKVKWLVFCDVFKGKLDPYRGLPVKSDEIVPYLTGALAVEKKDNAARLRFFFDWLDHSETEIANDAYKEFAKAEYKDFQAAAKDLSADKLAKWLQDPNTPAFRLGLYGSMLGHSAKPEHAELLRKLLDDPQKRISSGLDGMLAGYILLKPKEGWDYLRAILGNPNKEFLLRYAALRAVRFFWETRPDVIKKDDMVDAVCLLLDQSDVADLAIEDLRKWKQSQVLDKVLELNKKSTHDVPIIRRAILRFALDCKDNPKAKQFADAMRKKDPDWVKDVEELLKLETR